MGVDRLRAEYELEVNWIAFPLHPGTPDGGLSLVELFGGNVLAVDQALDRLGQVARSLGLPLGKRTRTYNSRLAQEVGKWAEEEGRGDQFHKTAFEAYFRDGINLALPEELVKLAEGVGLEGQAAGRVMEDRSHSAAVDRDWNLSRQMGVTAVPTFILGMERLVGMQPEADLEAALIRAGVKRRG